MSELSKTIKRTLASENPELSVDLRKMFDVDDFPNDVSLKQAIGQEILDKITSNTLKGDFIKESASAQKYSKEYSETLEFKVYGKQKSKVNLKASGDMLGSMQILIPDDDKIIVNFSDETEASKAHGHITGSVGKKRDFFGLTQSDLDSIAKKFKGKVKEAQVFPEEQDRTVATDEDVDFIMRILNGSGES